MMEAVPVPQGRKKKEVEDLFCKMRSLQFHNPVRSSCCIQMLTCWLNYAVLPGLIQVDLKALVWSFQCEVCDERYERV